MFCFFVFLLYNYLYFEYAQCFKKMTMKKLKDFIFEKNSRQIRFTRENSDCPMQHQKKKYLLLLATNLLETVYDASDAKEYYKSLLKNKCKKLVKQL